ncbi:ethanolamine transporter [Haloferax mucosum ATCC BAA-1512]|uniref:Ethanolamine transporter n=1 Tax=Haloferax mucosum ATCC BAA-1512 TaxID=662479 RepID=M0IGW5_9EURY|nr:APC family permease [Haloferax mucosum]ELZ95083.1 ethanolamine transporter [Haloferax mucosum ATCC BAA-1512]
MAESTASEFEGSLGLLDCIVLSLGGMAGSAIFIFPGTTGQLVGSAAIGAWFLAGVLMLALGLCYAELTLAFPKTGSVAVFPRETLGSNPHVRSFASYLEGVGYTVGWVLAITISALSIPDYLAVILPAAAGNTVVIAVSAICLATVCNLLGVGVTSRANLLLTGVVLAVLVLFLGVGASHVTLGQYDPVGVSGPMKFFAAVQLALTSYGAWTVIPSAVEEIKEPSRTVPRAIVVSLALTTLLYTGLVAVVHGVVPLGRFTAGDVAITAPLRVATELMGVEWLQYLLALSAISAIFTTMLVGILSAGRVLFALGENGTLPSVFRTTSSRFRVPWVGILGVGVVAGALATVPEYFYQLLVVGAIVGTGLPYAINVLSFLGLRYYRTDVSSSFRAPGGTVLAAVSFGVLGIAMLGLSSTDVVWSAGTLVVLSGYYGVRYVRHPNTVAPARLDDHP